MTTYATAEELEAYVGASQTLPSDDSGEETTRLLQRASEFMDDVTFGRAALAWADPLPDPLTISQAGLRDATCAQAEFWLEWGEDNDVVGYRGSVSLGKLTLSKLPLQLAGRAKRHLRVAGLLSAQVPIADELVEEAV